MDAHALTLEEAALAGHLRILALSDPEASREASEIRKRLRVITSEKGEIARLAAAASDTRVAQNRRRGRKVRA